MFILHKYLFPTSAKMVFTEHQRAKNKFKKMKKCMIILFFFFQINGRFIHYMTGPVVMITQEHLVLFSLKGSQWKSRRRSKERFGQHRFLFMYLGLLPASRDWASPGAGASGRDTVKRGIRLTSDSNYSLS